MPKIDTIADFWDCEIEHAEARRGWVNEHLMYIIGTNAGRRNLTKWEVVTALKELALEQALDIEWDIGDRILEFSDRSRLGLVAAGAGTMAGSSRVMERGELSVRAAIRGLRNYRHGVTRTAWYWTNNGKTFGKSTVVWAITEEPCTRDGLWVRRICERGCSDRRVWAKRFSVGASLPYCTECGSRANFGWAMP